MNQTEESQSENPSIFALWEVYYLLFIAYLGGAIYAFSHLTETYL